MTRAQATLRVRSADQFADHVGLLELRPSRLQSRFRVAVDGLEFDLPENEQVRVHVTSSTAPVRILPVIEVPLRRLEVTGVRFEGRLTDGSFVVHFVGNEGNIAAREIEPNLQRWFDPPERTIGLALSAVVRGRGKLHLDNVSVKLPPIRCRLPRGDRLRGALAEARFPSGSTAWPMRFEVGWSGPDQVSVDGYEFSLTEPDWNAVDALDRTKQLLIHGMAMAPTVIQQSLRGATSMARLLIDWSNRHPSRPHSTTVMAWNDMAVAKRTMAILTALDHLRFERPNEAEALTEMAASHATWLAHARNYVADHDHGLYADTALQMAARALSFHPLAERWQTLAAQRFESTAAAVIDTKEATVREHSPGYVDVVAALVEERRRNGLRDSVGPVGEGFERTLSALTTTVGSLIPWGDTSLNHASDRKRPRGTFGFPSTGWSISHHDDALVALTSAFHSRAHKHRDELSFVMFDRTGPVIFEAGLPGYSYGTDDRTYAESAQAHSGVLFDPPLIPEKVEPFGGCVATPAADGDWHVMLGWNPLLKGATHHRLLFHHPAAVVILDLATGPPIGTVTRLFHVAPHLEVRTLDSTTVAIGERHLTFFPAPLTTDLDTDRDSRHFPDAGSVDRHTTIRATNQGPGTYAAALARGLIQVSRVSTSASSKEMVVTVELDDGTELRVTGAPGATPRQLHLQTSQTIRA